MHFVTKEFYVTTACNQEIRSVNDALALKSRSEKLFPRTRRCFQLLLIVSPITRYMSQSNSISMTDCIVLSM